MAGQSQTDEECAGKDLGSMYFPSEVKQHNSEASVWLIIHNNVYDVTKFLKDHPGGSLPLLQYAGTDATEAFEDVGHSKEARKLMQKFKIGTVDARSQDSFSLPLL